MADADLVQATTSFRHGPTFVKLGELFNADDPVVKGREHLFSPAGAGVRVTSAVPGAVTAPPKRPRKAKAKVTADADDQTGEASTPETTEG